MNPAEPSPRAGRPVSDRHDDADGSTASSVYTGRFAPSPTGPLHAGSLVAALASWLDARAHGGRWLIRIEDVDRPRCRVGAAERILVQLAACGLLPDEPPWRQSTRDAFYEQASVRLSASGWAYPCGCSRQEVAAAAQAGGVARARGAEWIYAGTCREGLHRKPARALRLRVDPPPVGATRAAPQHPGTAHTLRNVAAAPAPVIEWQDRRLGRQRQDLAADVGDFVLKRADGCWSYQLAVVVDDAAQGITHVVRGEDLADNTPRQIHLQRLLHLPTPAYLHTPLVLAANGEKLSKQNGAAPLQLDDPLRALQAAGALLGIQPAASDRAGWLAAAVDAWHDIR